MTNQRAIKVINVFLGTDDLCSCSEDRLHVSCKDCRREAARMAIEALKEKKTGKWIKKSNTNPYWTEWWYECSECCHTPLHDRYRQETLSDYCPNCGTRMECEEE